MNQKRKYIQHFEKTREEVLSSRSEEEIIQELSKIISCFKKETFLGYIITMLHKLPKRKQEEGLKHLRSPMNQLIYLIDLFLSTEHKTDKSFPKEEEWSKITQLLNEIQNSYLRKIGYYNETNQTIERRKKTKTVVDSFITHFWDAQLSYEEQIQERLYRNCSQFDDYVKEKYGFTVNEAVEFCLHLKRLVDLKYNEYYQFMHDKENWHGLENKFYHQEEVNQSDDIGVIMAYYNSPTYMYGFSEEVLCRYNKDINHSTKSLLAFLLYNEESNKNRTVYFANETIYSKTPLVELGKRKYLITQHKFLIEAFYNRLNKLHSEKFEAKYRSHKSSSLENKTIEIFKKLFGNKAEFFHSYSIDQCVSEQDIMIIYKGHCLIIEIKDYSFRAPMRDPIKAYEKIKSDFKKSVQNGYQQCKRVEEKIEQGIEFKIQDYRTKRTIYTLKPSRITNFFSIVVTQHRYGAIQTNLQELLVKNEDDLYPWSVCADDLEAFTLLLIKRFKGMSRSKFLKYLTMRESFHERLECSDEHELCGFFVTDQSNFQKISERIDSDFATIPEMQQVFDAEYYTGLGFDNEINIELKKQGFTPKYSRTYTMTELSPKDFE